MSKAFDLLSVTTRIAPDMIKALKILTAAIIRISEVREDLKQSSKSDQRADFSK